MKINKKKQPREETGWDGIGSASLSQVAQKYGLSSPTFRRRLQKHELNFGTDRILTPLQIREIVRVLGHWDADYMDEQT